jgi:prefoldin subunit 5
MEQTRERLDDLRAEMETGQRQLELLDARRAELRDTLLRIAGAIQVLEELLAAENGRVDDGALALDAVP